MADRACVALLQHDQLLMVRQTYRGNTFWTFPGGAIEPGESSEAAAIREANEETGLDVEIIRLLCKIPRAPATGTYYCYLGRIIGGCAILGRDPELPSELQELHALQWFAVHDVSDHPEVARIWKEIVTFLPTVDGVTCGAPTINIGVG